MLPGTADSPSRLAQTLGGSSRKQSCQWAAWQVPEGLPPVCGLAMVPGAGRNPLSPSLPKGTLVGTGSPPGGACRQQRRPSAWAISLAGLPLGLGLGGREGAGGSWAASAEDSSRLFCPPETRVDVDATPPLKGKLELSVKRDFPPSGHAEKRSGMVESMAWEGVGVSLAGVPHTEAGGASLWRASLEQGLGLGGSLTAIHLTRFCHFPKGLLEAPLKSQPASRMK